MVCLPRAFTPCCSIESHVAITTRWPNGPKLSHSRRRRARACNHDIVTPSQGRNRNASPPLAPARCWPNLSSYAVNRRWSLRRLVAVRAPRSGARPCSNARQRARAALALSVSSVRYGGIFPPSCQVSVKCDPSKTRSSCHPVPNGARGAGSPVEHIVLASRSSTKRQQRLLGRLWIR